MTPILRFIIANHGLLLSVRFQSIDIETELLSSLSKMPVETLCCCMLFVVQEGDINKYTLARRSSMKCRSRSGQGTGPGGGAILVYLNPRVTVRFQNSHLGQN